MRGCCGMVAPEDAVWRQVQPGARWTVGQQLPRMGLQWLCDRWCQWGRLLQ
jgi:hypothetical protein